MKGKTFRGERVPELMGRLAELVAVENNRQSERIYALDYYGGKWIWLRWKEYAGWKYVDIVTRDTRVSETNLEKAIEIMRIAAREVA